jgi:hypothetical protein
MNSTIDKMWPNGVPAFGEEMKKEFLLGHAQIRQTGEDEIHEKVLFCNHGSYGATPRKVMDER